MDIEVLMRASSDAELVCELYKQFDENSRLNRSPAAKVEFITTTRYIGKYLKPGNKLLDIGAGAGEYSLHYANEGYSVTAVELADALCGGSACVNSGLDRADVAANHDGDQAGADLGLADEVDVCSLDHGVGSFNGADEAAGLNHTKC